MSIKVFRASSFENHDGGQPWCAVNLAITDARIHLTTCRASAQLLHVFIDLTQARRTDGFTACEASAIRVDRKAPTQLRFTIRDHSFLVPVCAKSVFRHM